MCTDPVCRASGALAAVILLAAASVRAQAPAPILQQVTPAGLVIGGTVRLTLAGKELDKVTGLIFSASGFQAALYQAPAEPPAGESKRPEKRDDKKPDKPSTLVWDVAVDAAVKPGLYDVRAVTAGGLSAPRAVHVAREALAAVPDPEKGQPVAIESPCRVAGLVEEGDVERFTYRANASERVVVEVFAERLDSSLDATLEVKGPGGRRLAAARDSIGFDPVLAFDARAGEVYTIELWEFTYRGKHPYLLAVGAAPRALFAFPPALVPGVATRVTLHGWNLPGGTDAGAGSLLETLSVDLTAPAVASPIAAHRRTADLVDRLVEVELPAWAGRPLALSAAASAPQLEQEPNDAAAQAMAIVAPGDVCGRFDRPGDRDWLRFAARKGETLELEVVSARLGARTDAVLLIARNELRDGKTVLRDLLFVDERKTGFPREDGFERKFVPPQRDLVAAWEAPEDGEYLLLLRSRNGRGGLDCAYHLALRRQAPGFSLVVTHAENMSGEAPVLRAGSSQSFDVLVDRRGGFQGAVRVRALDLPDGVACETCYVGPGESLAPLVLTAAPDAPSFDGLVRVTGEAEWEGERLEREAASSVMVHGGSERRHPLQQVSSRQTLGLALAVREAAPFAVTVEPAEVAIFPGAKATLTARVRRAAGFSEPVQIALQGLAERANADDNGNRPAKTTVEKEKNEATVEIEARGDAPYGERSAILYATAQVEHVEDPADPKSKRQKRRLTLVSNPVTVRVVSPVRIEVPELASATLPAGGSLRIPFVIERRPGVDAEVEMSIDLPKGARGYAADAVKLAKDATAGELVLRSDLDGAPGTLEGLKVRARLQTGGRGFEEKARCPFTVDRVEPLRIAQAEAPDAACRGGTLPVSFRLERRSGVEGKVSLTLQGPKGVAGLESPRLELEPGQADGVLAVPLGVSLKPGNLSGLRLEATIEKGGKRFTATTPLGAVKVAPAVSLAGPLESARLGVWRVPLRRHPALEPGREVKFTVEVTSEVGGSARGAGVLAATPELQGVLLEALGLGAPPAGRKPAGFEIGITLSLPGGELTEVLRPGNSTPR